MKSDRNPALTSEDDGTWNKDNITYQNLGMKLRHEGNYFHQVKQTEKMLTCEENTHPSFSNI